jgi:hypothetical protein
MVCPEIDDLVARPPAPAITLHCRECAACDALLALAELRELSDARDDRDDDEQACIANEIAIAEALARPGSDRTLASWHLEDCESCSETAVRAIAFGPIQSSEATRLVQLPTQPAWHRQRAWLAAAVISTTAGIALGAVALIALSSSEETAPTAAAPEPRPAPAGELAAAPPEPRPQPIPPDDLVVEANPDTSPLARGPSWVSITCEPECDDIIVGDKNVGKSPLVHHQVPSGLHRILLRRGSQLKVLRIAVMPGKEYVNHVKMTEGELGDSKSTRAIGFLTIVCDPFCDQVEASNRPLGASPVVRAALPEGAHGVTLRRAGVVKRISVQIVAGQTTARRVKMDR